MYALPNHDYFIVVLIDVAWIIKLIVSSSFFLLRERERGREGERERGRGGERERERDYRNMREYMLEVNPDGLETNWHCVELRPFFKALLTCTFMIEIPAGIYLLKVNNRDTRARCEICSKLRIKIPKRWQLRRFGIFIVNFEHISHLLLVLLLSTLNM